MKTASFFGLALRLVATRRGRRGADASSASFGALGAASRACLTLPAGGSNNYLKPVAKDKYEGSLRIRMKPLEPC